MHIRTLIVDDEPLARARLTRLLKNIQNVELIGTAKDGQEAVEIALNLGPDLIFMDIQMPIKTGIEAAKEIVDRANKIPAIIFCTAFDQFAIEAFKVNAAGYLLKPVSADNLHDSIIKATQLNQLQLSLITSDEENETKNEAEVSVGLGNSIEKFSFDQILYFRSEQKNVVIGLVNTQEVIVDYTLKELENKYSGYVIRIHRNTLVVRNKLKRMTKHDSGSVLIELNGSDIPFNVSRRSLSEVKKCFQ